MASRISSARKPLGKLAGAVLAVVVLLNSGYMLQVTTGPASTYIYYSFVFVAYFAFLGILFTIKKEGSAAFRFRIYLLAALVGSALLTSFANSENPLSYVHFMALLVVGCYVSISVPFRRFVSVFGWVMCTVVAVSLGFRCYIQLFGMPAPFSYVNTSVSSADYYNYLVFFTPRLYSGELARNQALFWEPGLFAGFCIMALCLEMAFSDKPHLVKIVLLVCGVITSSSAAGYLFLVLVALVALERFAFEGRTKLLCEIILLFLFLMLFAFSSSIFEGLASAFPDVFGKLVGDEVTRTTRLSVPLVNMSIYVDHPIFGAGLQGANEAFISVKNFFGVDSQTSTSTFLVAAFGIPGIIVNIIFVLAIAKLRAITSMQKLFIGTLFLLVLNVEPYEELALIWILFFYLVGGSTFERAGIPERRPATAGHFGGVRA